MKKYYLLFLLIGTLLVAALYVITVTSNPAESKNIRIGVLLPLSGPFAMFGEQSLQGIRNGVASSSLQIIAEANGYIRPNVAGAAHALAYPHLVHFHRHREPTALTELAIQRRDFRQMRGKEFQ